MKIICVGRNYVKHIEELKNVVLEEPAIFMKPQTALLKPGSDFVIPDFSNNIHHELEVVLKIHKAGKHIDEKFAGDYFDELSLGIDFTARDVQDRLKEKRISWELAKAFDGAAAIGEFIPKGKYPIQDLNFHLLRNEDLVQKGNTREMIFSFNSIISFVSDYFSLEPGDLVYTGTPAGVGKVETGDVLKGYLENEKLLEVRIR